MGRINSANKRDFRQIPAYYQLLLHITVHVKY